jgi:hypothetical protein
MSDLRFARELSSELRSGRVGNLIQGVRCAPAMRDSAPAVDKEHRQCGR